MCITICNHILPILKMAKLRNVLAKVMYSYKDREQASLDKPLPRIKPTALLICIFSSVQFSCPVVSDSLRPHGLQHARPPCPSPTAGVYSNSCSWSG